MKTDFIILRADGTQLHQSIDLPEEPGYDALRAIVEPVINGHFEHARVSYEGQLASMFVDESGLLNGLPRNERATEIYRAYWLSKHPGTNPESLSYIAGDVVLFTRNVWF
ncbi:MAG: hypothetical protein CMJ75_19050 [Planctomycetaceae bacterium]|nr:hypothetical protein [Planctomycetaceae bacterium]